MRDQRRTVEMTVMVNRMGYNEVTDAILGIGRGEVAREEYPFM